MKQRIKKYLNKLPKKSTRHFKGACPNCEFQVNGKFCSNCGQSTKGFHRPFWVVVAESASDAFSVDNKLLHTLIPLFLRPGYLTREFMRGRRVRYTPPFRLYLFLTFFAFLLLAFNHKPESDMEKNWTVEKKNDHKLNMVSLLEEMLSEDVAELDSLVSDTIVKRQVKDVIITLNLEKSIDLVQDTVKNQKTENGEEDLIENNHIRKLIAMWKLNPSVMTDSAFKKLSHTLLLILPLFAMALALLYIKGKHYLLEHLLISLNFHSYIFALVIISELILLINISYLNSIALYLYLLIPVQLFLTMKFYYRQSWIKTFLKFIIISVIYNVLLFIGMIISLAVMIA